MSATRRVLTELRRIGLLLKQDKALPSVVGLVTGEVLTQSWWGHPQANEIFEVLHELHENTSVLETKLIGGKVTFVHARLWPAWLGLVTAGQEWQTIHLSPSARRLLNGAEREGELEASGPAVKELERRLLVRSEQRHTESGKHVLVLESWAKWGTRLAVRALPPAESEAAITSAALTLGATKRALPWHAPPRARPVRGARAK